VGPFGGHAHPGALMPGVLDSITDGVVTITLNEPGKGNALSASLVAAATSAVDRAIADSAVHTLVLRGAGRHFCTGFDLSDLEVETDDSLLARFMRIELLLAGLWHAPLRTVAIAQGRVIGAGADLFAACDVRLLETAATLRFPGAGFGIVLGTRRLADRVGADRALAWIGSARTLDAQEAMDTGLASALLDSQGSAPVEPAVDRTTWAGLRAALHHDHRDADLAALVYSAARPGLKARIVAHRDRALAARS
jgi:enoyl-CoA hydratase/carnithine racemase